MLRSFSALTWLLLLGGMVFAEDAPDAAAAKAAKEAAERAAKHVSPKPQWTIKYLAPNTVNRPRAGYVTKLMEDKRTVCKMCLVCTEKNKDGKCCGCQCVWEGVLAKETYQFRALDEVKLSDAAKLPEIKIDTHQVKTVDIPR